MTDNNGQPKATEVFPIATQRKPNFLTAVVFSCFNSLSRHHFCSSIATKSFRHNPKSPQKSRNSLEI
ncbi:hypothetical protein L1987_75849 [Smallanthus sonchifolius]|uniref:Uncharacterized protein n=1 Tax=Smallanthus sonchifolius TaxID=185202 RepID=A0ACB9AB14_9ASTR|nr:hypothetical protein L1987_75849 [Smallanthus sonchifolius]